MSIRSLIVRIGGDTANLEKALASVGGSAKTLEQSLQKLGGTKLGDQLQKDADRLTASMKTLTNQQERVAQQATLTATGIQAIGGAARLTDRDLAVINKTLQEGLSAFRALGQQAPAELLKVAAAVERQQQALKNLTAKGGFLSDFGQQIAASAAGFITAQAAFRGVTGAVNTFIGAAKGAVDFASSLDDLSKATNVNVEALQELGFAGKRVGLELGDIGNLVGQLFKRIGTNDKGALNAIQDLGLDIAQLKAQRPEDLFTSVADAVGQIDDPLRQAAIGSELFGKQFDAVLKLARDGIAKTREEARKGILSKETVAELDQFGDNVGDLTLRLKVLTAEGLGPVATALNNLLKLPLHDLNEIIAIAALGDPIRALAELSTTRFTRPGGTPPKQGVAEAERINSVVRSQINLSDILEETAAEKALREAQQALFSRDVIERAQTYLQALGPISNVSKLTRDAQDQLSASLNAGADAFRALGQTVPAALATAIEAVDTFRRAGDLMNTTLAANAQAIAVFAATSRAAGFSLDVLKNQAQSLTFDGLIPIGKGLDQTTREANAARDAAAELARTHAGLANTLTTLPPKMDAFNLSAGKGRKLSIDWSVDLDQLAKSFSRMAQIAGGSLSNIVRSIGQFIALSDLAKVSVENISSGFKQLGDGKILSGLSNIGAGLLGLVSVATTVVQGIVSIFQKPEFRKIMSEVGRDWGVALSEGLAKQIEDTEKRLRDDFDRANGRPQKNPINPFGRTPQSNFRFPAELLNLSNIIEEAGGLNSENLERFAGRLRDIFSAIQRGELTAAQGAKILDQNFQNFVDNGTDKLGLLNRQLVEIVRLDRLPGGTQSKEVQSFVRGQVSDNIFGGLSTFAQNGQVTSQSSATALSSALTAGIGELQRQGTPLIQIVQQVGPIVDQLQKQFEAAGLSGGAAFAQVKAAVGLMKDEVAGPALTSVDGLRQVLVGLSNTGLLTQEQFTGIGDQVADTFNNLVAQGKDGDTALRLMQPTLQTLFELQQKFGFAVDANTQGLLDQASSQGIIGEKFKSTNDQILDVLTAIAVALGATLPDAAKKGGAKIKAALGDIGEAGEQGAAKTKDALDQMPTDAIRGITDLQKQLLQIKAPLLTIPIELGKLKPGEFEEKTKPPTITIPITLDKLKPGEFEKIKPPTIIIPIEFSGGGEKIKPPDVPGFADGSHGLQNFGPGTVAVLHGREAVLTEPEYRRLMVSVERTTTALMPPARVLPLQPFVHRLPREFFHPSPVHVPGIDRVPPVFAHPPPIHRLPPTSLGSILYFAQGGRVPSIAPPIGIQHFAEGGRVLPFAPRGTDTVPAMLTPGEFVLTESQQQAIRSAFAGGGGEETHHWNVSIQASSPREWDDYMRRRGADVLIEEVSRNRRKALKRLVS